MPLSPRVPARPARVRRALPGRTLIRLLSRIPARYVLAAIILSVVLLPAATPTVGKGAVSRAASRVNLTPTASGAEAAYPLNHTLDATGGPTGTPPANYDYETAPTAVGTPPTNSTLEAAPADAGLPANFDFAGDFTGWTTAGSPTIQTDTPHGKYAKLPAGAAITSSAFTIDAAAQALGFDLGYLTTNNYSWVKVYVLSGPTYSTETFLGEWYCFSCGNWVTITVDPGSYRGQSVKLKFAQSFGEVGVDNVKAQVLFPSYTTAGTFSRQSASGNTYARLDGSGALTTAAFTVDATAQVVTLRLTGLTSGADQYKVTLLSGTNFATSTQLAFTDIADSWTTLRYTVSAWAGQPVKLKVERFLGAVGVDDVGLQSIDIPNWTVSGSFTRETGGPTGVYARTNGTLTSAAFALPAGVQQLSVAYKGEGSGSQFYLELLRGTDFSQVVDLAGGTIVADLSQWKTFKAGVSVYAGETVKLRLRQYFGWGLFDTAGPMETLLPGWSLNTVDSVAIGEDINGTYATPYKSGGTVYLKSSTIQSGVIDRPNQPDARFFAVAYDIGTQTGSLLRVTWYKNTGENWVAFQDAADSPTGYRTKYFPVWDFMGQAGYFVVQVTGGKVYSIADNVARQQLAEPFSQKVGLQVDTSTGSFGYAAQDLATTGSLPLVFTRYYSGHSDRLGTLGSRWSHTYDTRLVLTGDSDAGVVFGSGSEAFFDWNPTTQTFTAADARVHDTLVKNGDGTFTFTTTSNLKYAFSSAGVLTSIKDLNTNTLTLAYDGNGRLTMVTDPGGRTLTLAYNANGRISTMTDPTNAVVTFGYNAAGDLATATDPLNKTETYSYNQHRLTSVVDKAGNTLFTNTFDSTHRVTQQTDAQNHTLTIAYDTPAKGATRVTNPTGNATTSYFDAFHRTTDIEDPTGKVYSSTYDANGNLFKAIDPAGNLWQFTYDSTGNPTAATDPLNQALQMTWNARHQPLTVRDKRGNVTTLVYDAAGNVTQKTDALGKVWTSTYDARGNMLTETNPLNQTTTHTYDTANHRLSTTDALNHTWTWTYDAAGRVLTTTNPLNQTTTYTYDARGNLLTETNPLNQTTAYTYDPLDALLTITDPLGNVTSYVYNIRRLNTTTTDPAGKVTTYTWDAARRVTSQTDPLGRTTTYTYDAAGRLLTETNPANGVTTYTYDTAGRLASAKDPLNRTTTYAYDTAGQVTSITAPNGSVTLVTYDADGNRLTERDALLHSTTSEYDALSRLKKITDAAGAITTFAFDDAGRQTSITDPLNRTTTTVYDAAGRRTSMANPLGQTTTYGYDNANRLTTITDPLNRVTTYGYDTTGRRTTVTDPANTTTTTTYDAGGRVTRVTRPSGAYTASTYDARGLLLTSSNNLGHTTTYAYDNAGQQVSMTDPRNFTSTYTYDAAGRQTSMTDALGGTVTYAYDAAGQQTAMTNARGKTTSSTYDLLGNVLSETDPLGRTTTHGYNVLGLPTQTTDPRGVVVSYGYDAVNRLTSMTYPGGSTTTTYDLAGQRTAMTDPSGTTTWTYDGAGRVLTTTAPQGTVSYGYNTAGQRTAMTLPGSRTVTYSYGTAGRMTTLTDWASRVITFGSNADGQRTTTTRPGGLTSTNTYDTAGRLTGVTHTGPGGTLKSYTYTLDAAGNRTGVSGPGSTETYTLDALGRITAVTYPNGDTSSYTYDAGGNRLSWVRTGTNPGTTSYTYDNADQLTTEGSVTYSYDAAGNVTAKGGDSFTWDWNNRLTTATVGSTTTTYAYDGHNTRVGKTQSGTTTNYLWDRQSGLPLLVDDGATSYVHAGGVQEQVTGGTAKSLLGDGLGSVRGAADGGGALVGAADYDVFGDVRGTSTTGSAFGFTGEQTDPETGSVFLRSRYYDPSSGRFRSVDSVQPGGPGTQGYHRYAYAGNSPTTFTDPSGHSMGSPDGMLAALTTLTSDIAFRAMTMHPVYGAAFAAAAARALSTPSPNYNAKVGVLILIGASFTIACFLDPDGCLQLLAVPLRAATAILAAIPGLKETKASKAAAAAAAAAAAGIAAAKNCFPNGFLGDYHVYIGIDNTTGEIVYVGITNDMAERQRIHSRNGRNFTIHSLGSGFSKELARGFEQQLMILLTAAGYPLQNDNNSISPDVDLFCLVQRTDTAQLLLGWIYPRLVYWIVSSPPPRPIRFWPRRRACRGRRRKYGRMRPAMQATC